jgi:hypothetical protein
LQPLDLPLLHLQRALDEPHRSRVFIVCLALAGLLAAKAVGTFAGDAGRAAHAELQLSDARH